MLLFERIPAGGRHIGIENGELAERSKAHDWKSCIRQKPYLGFKSLALRHSDFNYNRASMLRGTRCRPPRGGVAERLNAAVSKTVRRVIPVSRVRIPPPPPLRFCRLELMLEPFCFRGGGGIRFRASLHARGRAGARPFSLKKTHWVFSRALEPPPLEFAGSSAQLEPFCFSEEKGEEAQTAR